MSGPAVRRAPRRWTPDEDGKLLEHVRRQDETCTNISWNSVSSAIANRSNKDCRKRWHKLTGTKKGSWTASEDERLIEGVRKYGCKWVRVAEVVGTGVRTADRK